MSLSLPELERWWLYQGSPHLQDLVDLGDILLSRHDCGFTQLIQRKLRAFDGEDRFRPRQDRNASPVTCRPLAGNIRRKLQQVSQTVFKRPGHGGLCHDKLLDGLDMLQEVEIHRLRLVKEIQESKSAAKENHLQLAVELDHQATERYKRFQIGLRAMYLIDFLPQPPVLRDDAAKVMARLNALFPPDFSPRPGPTRHDLSPYTPALRDSLRLFVYEYLTNTHPSENRESFIDEFVRCCGNPSLEKMQNEIIRYTEETKKLEEIYFSIPRRPVRRQIIVSDQTTPNQTSLSSPAEPVCAGPTTPVTPCPSNAGASDTSTVADVSVTSMFSSLSASGASRVSCNIHCLANGVPGREISPAKTDGAAFAMDFDAPDVLAYPHDLSNHEFDVHPLARRLGLDSQEKARLGLVLPKERSSRDFWYNFDSDDEGDTMSDDPETTMSASSAKKKGKLSKRRRTLSSDTPKPPPLPPIPETYRHASSTLVEKILDRIRADAGPSNTTTKDVTRKAASSKAPQTSFKSNFSKAKRRAHLKSQISHPTLHGVHDFPLREDAGRTTSEGEKPGLEGPDSSLDADSFVECVEQDSCADARDIFQLAPPRLSPMEYTRMYLISKAQRLRGETAHQLLQPEKRWFWTPGWEKFLIIPIVPPLIGCGNSDTTLPGMPSRVSPAFSPEITARRRISRALAACPRLSLQLGGMSSLMPSVINLALLQMPACPVETTGEIEVRPRRRSRRRSSTSDATRVSLSTLDEGKAWTPTEPLDRAIAALHGHIPSVENAQKVLHQTNETEIGPSAEQLSGAAKRSLIGDGYSDIGSNHSKESLTAPFSPKARISSPRGRPPARPTFVSPEIRKRIPQIDGLASARVQSMHGSMLGDVIVDSAGPVQVDADHSSGVPFPSQDACTRDSRDQKMSPESQHQDAYARLSARRHSFHAETPASVQPLHRNLGLVQKQVILSPVSSVKFSYEDEDPFTDSLEHAPTLPLFSPLQYQSPPTSHVPVPDSPTLGQEAMPIIQKSNNGNGTKRDQAFQLLRSYVTGTQQDVAEQQFDDVDAAFFNDCLQPEIKPLQIVKKKKKPTSNKTQSRRDYSSSFALNRAKSHDAFTLLPRPSVTMSVSDKSRLLGPEPNSYSRPRTDSAASAAKGTALRSADTVTRFASMLDSMLDQTRAVGGQDLDSTVASCQMVSTRKKTIAAFGHLLSRHGRYNSSESTDTSCHMRTEAAAAQPLTRNASNKGGLSKPESSRDSFSVAVDGPIGVISGRSISSTSSNFAGLKDRFKPRKSSSS